MTYMKHDQFFPAPSLPCKHIRAFAAGRSIF